MLASPFTDIFLYFLGNFNNKDIKVLQGILQDFMLWMLSRISKFEYYASICIPPARSTLPPKDEWAMPMHISCRWKIGINWNFGNKLAFFIFCGLCRKKDVFFLRITKQFFNFDSPAKPDILQVLSVQCKIFQFVRMKFSKWDCLLKMSRKVQADRDIRI